MATDVKREEQFLEILQESSKKLVVVDFYSPTCPPCLVVDQILNKLAMQYAGVGFYKVDVKRFPTVSSQFRISATPTLHFFRKGRSVGEVRGADRQAIVRAIETHSSDSEDASAFGIVGHSDLTRLVLKKQSECLNQSDDNPMENIFTEGDSVLESDVDEQLVLHIAFNQPIKLHSIVLKAPIDRAPKTVKLFVNRMDIGFDDAESSEATQEIEMTEDMYKSGGVVNLRYVRFQNVSSLSLFVADNLGGDDVTAISQLAFVGTAVDTANVSDIRQGESGHSH
ncbi:hypothetical protein GGI04_003379 [Coemansia thaxteri]|uniref:Thioredoxin-like protein 1 n=1 Tax=Coemansia thaxteri TaxID=2663907 RepID=A0A9W8BKT4_9FUNG|nr:hypothetical protein GGI04_003379 [Coemansia thaxteri]KAJ2008636.1 hypothetical protein H4R26_000117 [Coemansia thaxteri]KAJ2468383.1 hypothetical protein GGI02_003714 [Coemansia sp. RSA 2322]KAJ2488118.1 hypothetical protein EV174_000078 [Coemansia sp. RSA 2320]